MRQINARKSKVAVACASARTMSPGVRLVIAMFVIMLAAIAWGLATMDCPPWRDDCLNPALERSEDELPPSLLGERQRPPAPPR